MQKRAVSKVADHGRFKSKRPVEAWGSRTSFAGREGTEMGPELEEIWG